MVYSKNICLTSIGNAYLEAQGNTFFFLKIVVPANAGRDEFGMGSLKIQATIVDFV